ncbi:PilW family protein [Aquibacillus kalidii]|uniref:PilW family protein n=1 Tax=Aquibacillus kalidii TaxID=2762597 RepID=UPI001645F50E|nr:type II secretion system protein [Aquibacillus kalidii]
MNNEKGITLVELLATLAIMSMIILLISSVHIFGQKQFTSQTEQIDNQANVRLVVNTLTKEIRTVGENTVFVNEGTLTVGTDSYKLVNNDLLKNDVLFVSDIDEFNVEKDGNKLTISVESLPNQFNKTSSLSTVVYIRE